MKNILLFPGQGYQSMEMLKGCTQDFICRNGLQKQLNEVLKDNKRLFDTEFAQPLIVATQLYEAKRIQEAIQDSCELEYIGISLGEITALIASGAIDTKEGLQFVIQRGIRAKHFSNNELQENIKDKREARAFGVTRVRAIDETKKYIDAWNNEHSLLVEKISITDYLPSADKLGQEEFLITADEVILRANIEGLGGSKNQEMVRMQCPFHSIALKDLATQQRQFFKETVSRIDSSKLPNVFSSRTGRYYSAESSFTDISDALAQYVVEPMQTTKMLQHVKDENAQVIVMMGRTFAEALKNQYKSIGGNPKQIIYIGDYVISKPENIINKGIDDR